MEELCADRPELLATVRRRIEVFDEIDSLLERPGVLPRGTRLGRLEIRGELGAGTMGRVYLGWDEEAGCEVAVKVFPREYDGDHERRARFLREAQVMTHLRHPNVVDLHGLETEDDRLFLVMERVRGKDLRSLTADGPLALETVLLVADRVLSVLDLAHRQGIVHRDIKPSNIMLTDEGTVKVLDFGLAHIVHDSDVQSLTDTDSVIGTIAYMAPEQLVEGNVTGLSDLFSLGAVLWEILCGRPPFAGPHIAGTIRSILEDDPPPVRSQRADTPPALADLVTGCLTKRPDERPPSARAAVARLHGGRDPGASPS